MWNVSVAIHVPFAEKILKLIIGWVGCIGHHVHVVFIPFPLLLLGCIFVRAVYLPTLWNHFTGWKNRYWILLSTGVVSFTMCCGPLCPQGLCRRQQKKMTAAILKAWDTGKDIPREGVGCFLSTFSLAGFRHTCSSSIAIREGTDSDWKASIYGITGSQEQTAYHGVTIRV